jgi:hypothetical protein
MTESGSQRPKRSSELLGFGKPGDYQDACSEDEKLESRKLRKR